MPLTRGQGRGTWQSHVPWSPAPQQGQQGARIMHHFPWQERVKAHTKTAIFQNNPFDSLQHECWRACQIDPKFYLWERGHKHEFYETNPQHRVQTPHKHWPKLSSHDLAALILMLMQLVCLQLEASRLQWSFLLTVVFGSFHTYMFSLLLTALASWLTKGKCL